MWNTPIRDGRPFACTHPIGGTSGKSVEFRRRLTYGFRDWPTWR